MGVTTTTNSANTYVPIATYTAGSAINSYTFSSIPSTYTDLVLVLNSQASGGIFNTMMQFNGDTGSNYSFTDLYGTGSSAASSRGTSQVQIPTNFSGNLTTTGWETDIVHLLNYSNTTTYKTTLGRANNAANQVELLVGLWRSTSAINSIKIFSNNTNNFATGSTFTLFGIKAA